MTEVNKMHFSSNDIKINEALIKIDDYIETLDLAPTDAIHVRLLMEEVLGMMSAMTGDYNALLWAEKSDDSISIKLVGKTEMDVEKKKELLSVSRTGENYFARGFMGKIGDMIQNGFLNYMDVMKLQQEYGGGTLDYASLGYMPTDSMFSWSLTQYKGSLDDCDYSEEVTQEAWDELEKSIVANIAKDVIVGIRNDSVELTIVKELSNK